MLKWPYPHSAYASIPSFDKGPACKYNSQYTAEHGKVFKVSSDDFRVLTDTNVPPLGIYHEKFVCNCRNRCASPNSTCDAVVFHISLQSGYQNCYLFDSIPPPGEHQSNYTFVYRESLASQYKPPPPLLSTSTAVYRDAGAVVGVSIALAIPLVILALY